MSILVTGGAGFIGSNLVDRLIEIGFDVVVLDNLSQGKKEYLNKKAIFVFGDIKNKNDVSAAFSSANTPVTWVFHCAAMSRIQPSIKNPLASFYENIIGTTNVLEECRNRNVKRFIYSASSSCYGDKNTLPLKEDAIPNCLNPYALSKKTGEDISLLYKELYGVSVSILRYFNVYGPRHQDTGDYATVIAIFLKQLYYGYDLTVVGNGEQRRDFTYIDDVVDVNIKCAMNNDASGQVFNVGTGRNYSINEVASSILELGKTISNKYFKSKIIYIPKRPGEAMETLADNSKLMSVFGIKNFIQLKEGLVKSFGFTRSNSTFIC